MHLTDAAIRETLEESRIAISLAELPERQEFTLIRETCGFLQFAVIGVDVPRRALKKAEPSPEGEPIVIGFADLARHLTSQQWTPSGKALVLAWLALGGKTKKGYARFGKLSGQELFEKLVQSL